MDFNELEKLNADIAVKLTECIADSFSNAITEEVAHLNEKISAVTGDIYYTNAFATSTNISFNKEDLSYKTFPERKGLLDGRIITVHEAYKKLNYMAEQEDTREKNRSKIKLSKEDIKNCKIREIHINNNVPYMDNIRSFNSEHAAVLKNLADGDFVGRADKRFQENLKKAIDNGV